MATTVSASPSLPSFSSLSWDESQARDLRIDLIRGLVMIILLTVHLDVYSAYTLYGWSRIGLVSGAEGFAILSGVVLGFVHRKRIERDGWRSSSAKLIDRAFQLYRVNLAVIFSVWLVNLLPMVDATHVMTFTDWGAGKTFPLYPHPDTPIHKAIAHVLLLRGGPHQIQILGLYTVLLLVAPFGTWLLQSGRVKTFLSISWLLYALHVVSPMRITQAQFEYGFPVLGWQLIFFHGLAAGYYRVELLRFARTSWGRVLVAACVVIALGLCFFVQNDPNPAEAPWARLSMIDPGKYREIVGMYGSKNKLGLLRLLNDFTLLVTAMTLLTVLWKPIHAALGWFLIPIGQASLYVFIVHVGFVCLLFNLPYFADRPPGYAAETFWLNTLAHTAIFLSIWLMVRWKVAYRWIPR